MMALQAMHAAYAFQEGENVRRSELRTRNLLPSSLLATRLTASHGLQVTNHDHPELTPHPFALHFSGPIARSAARDGQTVVVHFEHGEGLHLNRTLGCDIHQPGLRDFDG